MSGRVYFMQTACLRGPIKIGFTRSTDARLAEMHKVSPYPLTLLGSLPGTRGHEADVHAYLQAHHSHHEWFLPAQPVINTVFGLLRGHITFADVEGYRPFVGAHRTRRGSRLSLTQAHKRVMRDTRRVPSGATWQRLSKLPFVKFERARCDAYYQDIALFLEDPDAHGIPGRPPERFRVRAAA